MTTELVRVENQAVMSMKGITDRVNLVHQVMKKVMQEGTHFGTVPGCGKKQVLFKPGADVLAMAFRLSPSYAVDKDDLGGGHRFHRTAAAEEHRAALVDDEQHRAFAFLAVNPHLGRAQPGGGLPVDGPHVVAFVVVAQFLEGEAAAAEARSVAAGEQRADRLARQEAEAARLRLEEDQLVEADGDMRAHGTGALRRQPPP